MKDLTQGAVLRQLLVMSSTVLVGMAAQVLYGIVDLYFAGQLGARAQAAVAVTGGLMMAVMAMTQMLVVGTSTLVAQALGRQRMDAAQRVFDQALSLGLVLSLAFALGMLIGGAGLIRVLSADAETAALGELYMRWMAPAMALQLPMAAMGAALRGSGNMRAGVVAQVASVMLNLALAPALIFGVPGFDGLGVEGAGLASFVAIACCGTGLSLYMLRPQSFLMLHPSHWWPDLLAWGRMARIGWPAAAETGVMFCYGMVVIYTLRGFGPHEQAGFGAGQRLMYLFLLPAMALCAAIAPMAGQSYGAGASARLREIGRTALLLGVGSGVMLLALCELLAEPLIRMFSDDPAVRAAGITFLRLIAFNIPAIGVLAACFGMLAGMGNTVPTLIGTLVRFAIVALPCLLLSSRPEFQPTWIWCLSIAATTVQMLINLSLVRRELKQRFARLDADVPVARADAAVG